MSVVCEEIFTLQLTGPECRSPPNGVSRRRSVEAPRIRPANVCVLAKSLARVLSRRIGPELSKDHPRRSSVINGPIEEYGACVPSSLKGFVRVPVLSKATEKQVAVRVCGGPWLTPAPLPSSKSSYLVDPASGHMLVSKTKPCMSKYKP